MNTVERKPYTSQWTFDVFFCPQTNGAGEAVVGGAADIGACVPPAPESTVTERNIW